MRVVIEFDTDNAAFADYPGEEARILQDAVKRIAAGQSHGDLYDYNGNKVGTFSVGR